jgi:hypothetical protein
MLFLSGIINTVNGSSQMDGRKICGYILKTETYLRKLGGDYGVFGPHRVVYPVCFLF